MATATRSSRAGCARRSGSAISWSRPARSRRFSCPIGPARPATRAGAQGGCPMTFRTTLCELLGIEYPIVQSGMGAIAGPELVAEVCRGGGLGILAGLNVPPDDLRKMIHRTRELTSRPFGVNLWLHRALRPPIDPDAIREETLRGAQEMLNRFSPAPRDSDDDGPTRSGA